MKATIETLESVKSLISDTLLETLLKDAGIDINERGIKVPLIYDNGKLFILGYATPDSGSLQVYEDQNNGVFISWVSTDHIGILDEYVLNNIDLYIEEIIEQESI